MCSISSGTVTEDLFLKSVIGGGVGGGGKGSGCEKMVVHSRGNGGAHTLDSVPFVSKGLKPLDSCRTLAGTTRNALNSALCMHQSQSSQSLWCGKVLSAGSGSTLPGGSIVSHSVPSFPAVR